MSNDTDILAIHIENILIRLDAIEKHLGLKDEVDESTEE